MLLYSLGPLAKRDSWAWDREVLDRLITHLLESLFWDGSCKELAKGCMVGVLTALWERSLSISFPLSLLNLFTCLSLTLIYLSIVVDVTKDANLDLHLSSLSVLFWRMLNYILK